MRKTKDIKRKKVEAGIEYKRGNRKDAYKIDLYAYHGNALNTPSTQVGLF